MQLFLCRQNTTEHAFLNPLLFPLWNLVPDGTPELEIGIGDAWNCCTRVDNAKVIVENISIEFGITEEITLRLCSAGLNNRSLEPF